MNFKRQWAFVCALLVTFGAKGQNAQSSTVNAGGIEFTRPLVLRSDFVAKDVLRRFMIRSKFSDPERMARFIGTHPGVGMDWFSIDYVKECRRFVKGDSLEVPTPKLKGGKTIAVAEGFDRFGGSRFPNGTVLMTKRVHFWEREFEIDYRSAMQKYVSRQVASDPEYYRGIFSDEYIDRCISRVKDGKYVKTNPIAANGDMCEFNHCVGSKKFEVLTYKEHKMKDTLPSKGHGSGTKFAGGGDMTWQQTPKTGKIWASSASRWGGIAGIDIILSSAALIASETKDKNDYIVNAGSVAAAYLSATITESMMVKAFSLSAGTTPAWFGSVSIGMGGVASWLASGVYFVMRSAVMYGWKRYQLQQAIRVENACRVSEQAVRRKLLSDSLHDNSDKLMRIIMR